MKPKPCRWPVVFIAVLCAVLTIGVLATGAGLYAIARGTLNGPAVQLNLGSYQLIARTTERPECLPLTVYECFVSFPTASVSAPRYYAVWLGQVGFVPAPGTEARVTVSKGWHLLQLQLH
ncbi:hypothetical protein HC891_24675 [Candidatus Gracilibacteria bacterium]|nr:hypothetical protein [Candidatus Gracilibacteria bacterium]